MFIPDTDFWPIQDPGSSSQKVTGSRIRIRNTVLINYESDWIRRSYPETNQTCQLSIKSRTSIDAQATISTENRTGDLAWLTSSFMPRRKTPGGWGYSGNMSGVESVSVRTRLLQNLFIKCSNIRNINQKPNTYWTAEEAYFLLIAFM